MDFASVEGLGSTFWFEVALPVAEQPEPTCPQTPRATAREPRRLLLAEDVPLNQELACAVLRQAGHLVDVVADGAAALDAVKRQAYDLILMDIQMPVLDGLSAITAGADDHVSKPFRREVLLDVIDRLTRVDETMRRRLGAAVPDKEDRA